MNLLAKLEYQIGFSDLEKEIAEYIILNRDKVVTMKLTDLAKATYTSPSTVSRLCRKLGEKNYNDFRLHFATAIQSNYSHDVDFNKPFDDKDSSQTVVHNIGKIYKETISATDELLDLEILYKVVDILNNADVIDVYGSGDSFLSALMFQHKIIYINKVASISIIPTDQNQKALYTTKDTVALMISYSGETEEIKKIIDLIKSKGGTLIGITSIDQSYLREKADYCLSMCSKENIVNKIGVYSSKISSDYIIDLIYSLLFQKKYYDHFINKVQLSRSHDERINKSINER